MKGYFKVLISEYYLLT